jgi:hypothetical protein
LRQEVTSGMWNWEKQWKDDGLPGADFL